MGDLQIGSRSSLVLPYPEITRSCTSLVHKLILADDCHPWMVRQSMHTKNRQKREHLRCFPNAILKEHCPDRFPPSTCPHQRAVRLVSVCITEWWRRGSHNPDLRARLGPCNGSLNWCAHDLKQNFVRWGRRSFPIVDAYGLMSNEVIHQLTVRISVD